MPKGKPDPYLVNVRRGLAGERLCLSSTTGWPVSPISTSVLRSST